VVFDALAPGRGIARVRYNAEVNDDTVSGETVTSEYVPWKNFRRGPGLVWNDVDWIGFKHYLSREQLVDLAGEIGNELALDHDTRTGDKPDKDGKDPSDVFLRACVWEIWDKMSKRVLFIAPCYPDKPIREEDDPLQLTGFFPIPKPIQPLDTPCDLVPVPPYRAYKHLAEELNEVTIRIKRLVRQIKVRGIYASSAASIEQIVTADDGELVAAAGLEFLADGGLDKAIAWWPIEPQVNAIRQLVEHREAIKTTIYEVSGLADIMRGNSNAQETLGAQQIKAQWGSLRIQRVQADVQRFCRDLFRMKAELIAQRFDIGMLQEMTGIKLASQQEKMAAQQQAQQAELQQQDMQAEALQALRSQVEEIMELPTTEEVERYTDAFFKTIQVGATTLPELSASFSQTTGSAALLNIPIETLAAAFASVTAQGANTSEAATRINGVLAALTKPTSQAADEAKRLGIEFSASAVQSRGLESVLADVDKATNGNAQSLALLFGRQEAIRGVVNLTADGVFGLTAKMREYNDITGITAEAAAAMAASFELANARIQTAFREVGIRVGLEFLETYQGIGVEIRNILYGISDGVEDGAFDSIIDLINEFGRAMQATLADVAKNLPEALKLIDLGPFESSLRNLATAVGTLFDGVDVSTPRGLADAIDSVVKVGSALINTTAGIVEGLKPFIDAIL
jgi:TP901 family phage tail tape measure protein